MLFSIVMPLYDKAPFVEEAIASVLNQSVEDWELIVVDDGSTDGGGELVEKIPDDRVRVIRQANAGVAAARNAGIEHARGQWTTFLDPDDWYHPEYLSVMQDLAGENPSFEVLAVRYVAMSVHDWAPWPWPLAFDQPPREQIDDVPYRWLSREPPFHLMSLAVRSALLKRMQPCFPVGESSGEDLDLIFRLAERFPIAADSRRLAAYRRGTSNSLSDEGARNAPELEAYVVRMEQRADLAPMTPSKRAGARWYVGQSRIGVARKALAMGHRRVALRMLWDARNMVGHHRWWVTLGMLLLMTSDQVRRRERRVWNRTLRAQSVQPALGSSDKRIEG
jgi:glycosyltransferase involved in cell wall biosynthesis